MIKQASLASSVNQTAVLKDVDRTIVTVIYVKILFVEYVKITPLVQLNKMPV